jgi:hypothetical protein
MAYEARVPGVTSTRTLRTAMTNYLVKRGNRYYFRRKIPLELLEHFGRNEIVKALGTSDPHVASVRCREHAVMYDTIFAAARKSIESLKATASVRASLDAAHQGAIAGQRDNVERAQAEHNEGLDLPPYFRTPSHTKVDESVLRRNSRGERYFSALCGCLSL